MDEKQVLTIEDIKEKCISDYIASGSKGTVLLFAKIGDNEPVAVTNKMLDDYLFDGCEDKIEIIDFADEVNLVIRNTSGATEKETYIDKLFLRTQVLKKLDGRLGIKVIEGIEGIIELVNGIFDAKDISKVVSMIIYVRDNRSKFYND